jgi:8-oxo-dGTP pyrophosphatase MutT (NUDIX family)
VKEDPHPLINRQHWREILSAPLPGEIAHHRMSPRYAGEFFHETDPIEAAVMILMYPFGRKLFLALIKRNEYPGHHSAQVSFPGGMKEISDDSLEFTARRETCEELGIPDTMEILGSLTPLYIPVSNYLVTPFVGCVEHHPDFQPDETEVQYVIEAAVEALKDPMNRKDEELTRHGKKIVAPCYRIGEELIWGATAMMLSEFLAVVRQAGFPDLQ